MKPVLSQEEKDRLAALARKKGLKGLGAEDIQRELGLALEKTLALSQALEQEGEVLILSFAPLRLMARSSLDFLRQKVKEVIGRHHRLHPSEWGMVPDRLGKRFAVSRRILSLALQSLIKEGELRQVEGRLSLADFTPSLSPREEKLLVRLEEVCLQGDFGSAPLDEFRARFHLSAGALDRMLSILISRRKIVRGRNGLYLHSRWLEEVVDKIRSSSVRELSIADFKKMTGLSRKYAIPLLELLDRMGVTRRKGSLREVLEPAPKGEHRGKQ